MNVLKSKGTWMSKEVLKKRMEISTMRKDMLGCKSLYRGWSANTHKIRIMITQVNKIDLPFLQPSIYDACH